MTYTHLKLSQALKIDFPALYNNQHLMVNISYIFKWSFVTAQRFLYFDDIFSKIDEHFNTTI